MPRIVFIRPAETDYALRNHILGRSDPELNETGVMNANILAEVLRRYQINFVAVSPLRRAVATAQPIERSQDVFIHPVRGFQAMDMGDWDGRDLDIIKTTDRGRYDSWWKDADFPAPGGESIREVYARAYPELVNIVEHASENETIALILQQTVLRAMCCAVMNLRLEVAHRFHMDHAAFSVFERAYPGGPYQMMGWNHNEHLPDYSNALYEMETEPSEV